MLMQILKEKIQQHGPIDFAEFMATALYHPEHGYYCNNSPKFGRSGDFVTAPELGELFATCLGKAIKTYLHQLKQPKILEFGAGSGKLAKSIFNLFSNVNKLEYHIIEISPYLKQQQQQLLASHNVFWHQEIPKDFSGVIIANEFIDALPVSCFTYKNNNLYSRYVTLNKQSNQLEFTNVDAQKNLTNTIIPILPTNIPDGYTFEVNANALSWLKSIFKQCSSTMAVIIDYGFEHHEYYHPQRDSGTLMAHHKHTSSSNVLEQPGKQDITAHVNFSDLIKNINNLGGNIINYQTFTNFLLENNITDLVTSYGSAIPHNIKQELITLTHPAEMGELFKVLQFKF